MRRNNAHVEDVQLGRQRRTVKPGNLDVDSRRICHRSSQEVWLVNASLRKSFVATKRGPVMPDGLLARELEVLM